MAVEVTSLELPEAKQILTDEALEFLEALHREFEPQRKRLMEQREQLQQRLLQGWRPDFRHDTRKIREGNWVVGDVPDDIQDRRVEITGPTDRKMIINALNSGARVFMADFEDATSPTWRNVIHGQLNLVDAIEHTIQYLSPTGEIYQLEDHVATLMVRPRGWHLREPHLRVDGAPMAAAFVDFGLYVFHNAHRLRAHGSSPYFYLPKLESMEEAQLWEDVLQWTENHVGLPTGTIKVTVLIETIMAAFQMDEILWALRPHVVGLNAGRWDYLFSIIKKFRGEPGILNADRQQITMTVPFMRAYTELLVHTCHRRGAYAIGGMAAFIPSRRNPEINQVALAKVREDKEREAHDGFDGTWVAHPDLVPVAKEVFDRRVGAGRHQRHLLRDDVQVTADHLLNFRVPGGTMTEVGLRNNVAVAIQYLAAWLGGVGAVSLYNLMEDAATAEIARAQVWQWVNQKVTLENGRQVTPSLIEDLIQVGLNDWGDRWPQIEEAVDLFRSITLGPRWVDFLTIPAYDVLWQLESRQWAKSHN
ncbi:MAG: malate synthase A [Firmicutes bacterium]|nr:malate synthase A [Bacillota bacterium]